MTLNHLSKNERRLIRRALHEAAESIDGLIDSYCINTWGQTTHLCKEDAEKVEEWKQLLKDWETLRNKL